MDVPSPIQMMRILRQIEAYTNQDKKIYLHCWGGLGRAGIVVGCYLLKNKLANKDNVFDIINKLKESSGLANRDSPLTSEQRAFVLDWIDFVAQINLDFTGVSTLKSVEFDMKM